MDMHLLNVTSCLLRQIHKSILSLKLLKGHLSAGGMQVTKKIYQKQGNWDCHKKDTNKSLTSKNALTSLVNFVVSLHKMD